MITIKVKSQHIEQAKRGDMSMSPVSLAMRETFGGNWTTYRTFASSPGFGKYGYVSVYLPKIARVALQNFDYGEDVAPFKFRIRVPAGLDGRFIPLVAT